MTCRPSRTTPRRRNQSEAGILLLAHGLAWSLRLDRDVGALALVRRPVVRSMKVPVCVCFCLAVVVFCDTALLCTCVGSRQETPGQGLSRWRTFKEAYNAKWAQYTRREFRTPDVTPYDTGPIIDLWEAYLRVGLRQAYLRGYMRALAYRLEHKGGDVVCFFPKTEEERAHARGFDAGQEEVLLIVDRILAEIDAEMVRPFAPRPPGGSIK